MAGTDTDRAARAARRRETWAFELRNAQGSAPFAGKTAAERLAAVEGLSADAWTFTGRAPPQYERWQMPGVVHRPSEGK